MGEMTLQAGDIVEARLTPLRTDDLVPAAASLVGTVRQYVASWIVDDDFPYAGQWRMELMDRVPGVRWVPECDLSEIVHVGIHEDYGWERL